MIIEAINERDPQSVRVPRNDQPLKMKRKNLDWLKRRLSERH
jgi:hypothetical protein